MGIHNSSKYSVIGVTLWISFSVVGVLAPPTPITNDRFPEQELVSNIVKSVQYRFVIGPILPRSRSDPIRVQYIVPLLVLVLCCHILARYWSNVSSLLA